MKRRLLTMLLMAVSITLTAFGTNKLTITGGEGHPGDEVTVSVSLENSDEIAVAEVKIPLDTQFKYVEGSCLMNETRADGHVMSCSFVDNALVVVIYSVELKSLKGESGELFHFKVKVKKEPATYTLSATAVFGNASGENVACEMNAGNVTILSPKLTIISTTTDYGHIPIRSIYTREVTIQNTGNEPLEVSSVEFSAVEFSTEEPNFIVEAGATKNVSVNYAPVVRGAISETVSFISNAINGTQKATLIADPFSVNELHVGSASGICDEEVTITLTMNNMESIVGMQCEFTLPEQLVYVEDSFVASDRASDCMVNSVADGQKLTLMMYNTSSTPVADEDGVLATFKLKLDGTNGTYYLKPENVILSNATAENMTSATSYGRVTIQSPKMESNATLDMGSNPVTETVKTKYMIKNTGKVTLTIDKINFLAEGYIVAEELPISIEPRQSAEITVQYAPNVKGNHSVQMNIYTNDPLNRMKEVTVSGNIYEPNSLSATGELSDNGYNFTVNLDNYTGLAAMQMDVHWLSELLTSQSLITLSDRLNGFSYVVQPIDDGVYRLIFYSLTGSIIPQGNGEVFTLSFENTANIDFNKTEIVIDNIVLSNAKGENESSQTLFTYNVKLPILGDINDDGEVNVTDIVALYSYILGNSENVEENIVDINGDGEVNVTDIVSLYGIILNSNN